MTYLPVLTCATKRSVTECGRNLGWENQSYWWCVHHAGPFPHSKIWENSGIPRNGWNNFMKGESFWDMLRSWFRTKWTGVTSLFLSIPWERNHGMMFACKGSWKMTRCTGLRRTSVCLVWKTESAKDVIEKVRVSWLTINMWLKRWNWSAVKTMNMNLSWDRCGSEDNGCLVQSWLKSTPNNLSRLF